jgi:hypothetical protein
MANEFPTMEPGDEVEPFLFNIIFRELERWRKLSGSGFIHVDDAGGKNPPRIVDWRGAALVPALLTGGIAAGTFGSPASAAGTILVPNAASAGYTATGGRPVTIYNMYATAVTGSNKFCWLTYSNNQYYLVVADC